MQHPCDPTCTCCCIYAKVFTPALPLYLDAKVSCEMALHCHAYILVLTHKDALVRDLLALGLQLLH